ncbi:hypothetical protein WQ53_07985 [Pseudoxanthomonas suwonensis]|uniref:Uncharacterized protein n=1 Tax=Pseudoxanthomonas suwonensis TaxID=314722 RepID=A0A0E3Z398_9GAMM|nr:hypothetical protein WQ53_07985 [Pseudoxanthomonas suwonensis]
MPALAQQPPTDAAATPSPASGLVELTDEEMGDMRGRYTVNSNTVAWFGVTMVSTWQTQSGAQLQSTMKVAMDASRPGKPTVTFQPHVSITAIDAPSPVPSGLREIDNAGLANVTGVTQSVQVAGDGNLAHNIAHVTVRDQPPPSEASGASPASEAPVASATAPLPLPSAPSLSAPLSAPATTAIATTTVAGMNAVAQVENNAVRVLLQIDGQGAVEQWIGRSGLGQTIQLAADGQRASNWMELEVVRNTTQGRPVLGQNVAQAIALSRGIAIGY